MTPRLTLICPTYNRHLYLQRSAQFWCNRNVNVIYSDGSEAAYSSDCLNAPNISYLHYPAGLQLRLLAMLAEVKTPYVCMMGDDEFYIPSALQTCVDYLEGNGNYVACMGRAIGFSRLHDKIALRPQYPRLRDRDLDDSAALNRLESHFSSYVPAHCYAVARTDVFRSAMQAALSIELDIFAIFELVEEFLVVAAGKSIVLPVLYWLRSHEAPPLRKTGDLSLDPSKRFDHWWQSKESEREKEDFCKYLSTASHGVVSEGEVEKVLDCYHENSYGHAAVLDRPLSYRLKRALPLQIKKPLQLLRARSETLLNQLTNPAAQSKAALHELRLQGIMIDEDGLAECLASINKSWKL